MRNFTLLIILVILCGCTGKGTTIVEVPVQTTSPEVRYSFVPIQELSGPTLDPELAPLFPSELQGLLPLNYFTDPLGNDLSIAAPLETESILTSIEKAAGVVYIEPRNSTNILVFYRVYKMNESEYAQRALNAYKSSWNRERWGISGKEVWIWKGYEEQIATNQFPFPAGKPLYWDHDSKAVYFSRSPQVSPVVALLGSNLYGLHGEAAFGEYFVMMDVQSIPQDIEARAKDIFSSILSQDIYQGITIAQEENVTVQIPADKITDLKEKIKQLNEDYYVKGNLSEDEYNIALEEYLELLSGAR